MSACRVVEEPAGPAAVGNAAGLGDENLVERRIKKT